MHRSFKPRNRLALLLFIGCAVNAHAAGDATVRQMGASCFACHGTNAQLAGVVNVDNRWCGVDFTTYESSVHKNIHVIGDAIAAPLPKSGHMANQTGKVCAGAIVALVNGKPVVARPKFANTCYSFVSAKEAMNVAGVYEYDPQKKSMVAVEGTVGVSGTWSETEGAFAQAWAMNIWSDTLR